MGANQHLELADQRLVATERQVRIDALLDRRHASLLQACDLGLCEVVERKVGKGSTSPKRESLDQRSHCFLWIACAQRTPTFFKEPLEPVAVELVSVDAKHVAGAPSDEDLLLLAMPPARSKSLAELRDVHLGGLHGRRSGVSRPHVVDQAV